MMQTDHMRDEFATLRIMGRMSVTGIHEAGHAVVGAYLHLPVVSVGLKRGRFSAHDGSMSFRDGVAGRTFADCYGPTSVCETARSQYVRRARSLERALHGRD